MQTIEEPHVPQWNLRQLFYLTIILHYVAQTRTLRTELLPHYQTLVHIRLFVSCIPHYVASFCCSLKLLHCTNNLFKFIWFTCFPSSLRNNNKKYIKQLDLLVVVYNVPHVLHSMLTQLCSDMFMTTYAACNNIISYHTLYSTLSTKLFFSMSR